MNYLGKIIFYTIMLCVFVTCQGCQQPSTIEIRPAFHDDMEHINMLSIQHYQNGFKLIWEQHYAPLFPVTDPETFVQEKIVINETNNKKAITDQENGGNLRLIVAEQTLNNQKKIVGYCRFEKLDMQTVYVHFLLTDETLHKQGIAKKLVYTMMNAFENIKEFKFRALKYNDFANALYTKHNCKQTGTVALDINTGKISTDPDAPITHYDYSYINEK